MITYKVSSTCYLLVFATTLIKGNVQDHYIGCYFDDPKYQHGRQKITLQNNTTLTIEWCIGQCLQRNSTYAGLENSKECLCRNNFGVVLPDASCKSPCPRNQSEYCGGSNGEKDYYSLYTACVIGYYGDLCDKVCHCRRHAPCDRMTGNCPNECDGKWFGRTCSDINLSENYIGCFRDNESRAIPSDLYYNSIMTVEFCTNMCNLRNNSIAGLQFGGFCFCGETYAKYGPLRESICDDTCWGNGSQICGGEWANSVYSVCPAGYYGSNCLDQCDCYNNSRCVYLTGECNSACKAGWTGSSCNIRDCMTEGGGCFQNETCATINLNFATITGCHCSPGYDRKAFWDTCEDVDECTLQFHNCSDVKEECNNTIGSFSCICKTGFNRNNETCEDIDECNLRHCDNQTTTCTNTMGSFVCNCKNGYKPGSNKTFCEDIDECNLRQCDSQTTTCSNTMGSYACNCKNGYKPGRNKTVCEDIDECNLRHCDNQTTTCSNIIGSYVCHCKNGYKSGNKKTVCEDIDECKLRRCDTQTTTCTNTMGSYVCNCKNGYKPGSNKTFCEDIDECKRGLCDKQTTTCTNIVGSFVCNCNNGYRP